MTHVPHELAEEFPHMQQEISDLKAKDGHFAKLFDDYHTLNRAIHRAETNIEPTDDYHMIAMRKERLALKDKIAACLASA
ncbi:YdcH family protein [Roseobacter weihaiensis]|uniref:YdcH family protein n=1 Tax=Roseobacter weihaiensis TaxID=2763262 RepID=UPI001D0BA0E1|nr:YdcH family protein [Roseobacter sp. H9]